MTVQQRSSEELSMPALLRHARLAFAVSMRRALEKAAYDDIPHNGLYVIGGLASQSRTSPLGNLIEELQLSKQAAGQLVDTLVRRGYLKREVDPVDRRRLTIALTSKGRAAAKVLGNARAIVDEQWLAAIGPEQVESARKALFVLAEIGRKAMATDER